MEIREIFENKIKIEPKVMSIEVLFNNPERLKETNYKPFYQRNYVWDDEKATYFIESILLGTEIPPLIYFRNSNKVEVIDGRQRYQTILRFISNEFKLKKNGLPKLQNIGISNNYFRDLDANLQDLFWDTKLRLIEFSFHSQNLIDEEVEDVVKKEIFKRYNSGITPLKPTEIDSAFYFDDDLNSFFKQKLISDQILFRDISNVLHFEKTNNEVLLKKIRQLLVQHKIPIKFYAVKKNIIIAKFYEFSFSDIDETEIRNIYSSFIDKINLIKKIKSNFTAEKDLYNRLISECLFWVFSIMEDEKLSLSLINQHIIDELVEYIYNNIESFETIRSSFAKELYTRYDVISIFFSEKFDINFTEYLHNNSDFKQKNKEIIPEVEELKSFDDLRINKPEPSSIAIVDICRQMSRNRFLIRPPYQRKEVINKKKSSSIIESILLGIKLPPIFIYKRKDGISEVLDGQQRLLSILGFIKEPYLDETNKVRHSDKNGFSLYLKNSILKNLHGKKYEQLTRDQQYKIKNFDLWIIEINYKNNINFEPIDLFLRLNNKPYPIKEDTFEMWNSYVSRDIILTIQAIYKNNNDWFYIRKNNSRMENENIYTALAYFQYTWIISGKPINFKPKDVDIYKVVDKINFRIKSKNEITKVLEDISKTERFINSANNFEFNFIKKLRILFSDNNNSSTSILNNNLEDTLNIVKGRRTQQAFYALWYFLFDIPFDVVERSKVEIRKDLKSLFKDMSGIESKELFHLNIDHFKSRYNDIQTDLFLDNPNYQFLEKAQLGNISIISQGVTNKNIKPNSIKSEFSFPYFEKGEFNNYQIRKEDISYLDDVSMFNTKDFFSLRDKILLKRNLTSYTKFSTAYFDSNLIFKPNTIGIVVNRYGFETKYVLAILSSRYCFNVFYLNNFRKIDDSKNISLSEIRAIDIPVIPTEKQLLFSKIVDYVLICKIDSEATLFFERLIDAMVYELFYQVQFENASIKISEYLKDLPPVERKDDIEFIDSIYKKLSNPNHELNTSLLKILNINEITAIENNFENF
ncbi:DUF262 domain-containing protein [Mesonia maritima]|uniref:GmrSD restriction endonucleases N-terminal domain-containing protein n=1 Tax=Mesonia maritima TaxID=1793873 RepID=A0ABU1KAS4_9FLAO|nr:DUF262 domain-containing protein [Mesonia maritima]MDR6301577.1 hypothetical protein [Mesonia maritima]